MTTNDNKGGITMMNISRFLTLLGLLLAVVLHAAPAQAQATRTWVSGVGDDVNPCSRTAPCKTFAGAISKTAAGGEINCIDPGGFGALTITKAITIDCTSTEAGVLVSGTNGFVVNAGAADTVILRGLDIIGTVVGPGLSGIAFNTGKALLVDKCTIREFLSSGSFGILFQPTGASSLYVSDTTIANNGSGTTGGAIDIKPSGTGAARVTINGVSAFSNVAGIIADGSATTAESVIDVINTVSAGATAAGILALTPTSGGGAIAILVDRSSLINNVTGASASGPKSSIFLTNTTIFGNTTGLVTSAGSTLSYKTNNINGGNDTDGTPTVNLSQD
jgi:hypothetical protein